VSTELYGIQQAEVLIKAAIIEALDRLQNDEGLIREVFASLGYDPLYPYGSAEIEKAVKWLASTNVPVFMSYKVDDVQKPCISISLKESAEADQTLGDVHYVTSEPTDADWPPIAGPFTPTRYSPSTGIMVIPTATLGTTVLQAGMHIIDRDGRDHMVQEVLDDDTVSLVAGTVADFTGAYLKGSQPKLITSIESVNFRETYEVGCHAQGEPVFLSHLHSVVVYLLLKFKEELLEARGFERSSISSGDFRMTAEPEIGFSRSIMISGYCRGTWGKNVTERIQGLNSGIILSEQGLDGSGTELGEDDSWVAAAEDVLSQ